MEQNNQLQQERREARRKRRQRNQIAAYFALIFMIMALAAGIVFCVQMITSRSESASQQQDKEAQLEEIFSDEEELEEPAPEAQEPVVELTEEQKLDQIVNAGIEVMPIEDKVAGLFIVAPEAITGVAAAVQAGDGTRDALSKYAVGGLVYFDKNMKSKEQLSEMIENTLLYTKYPLFIAVDEEGGSVARVASAGIGTKVESAQAIGESQDASNAYQAGSTIGSYLSELGFNLDFAPVADLANVDNSVMQKRAYGSEANVVIPFVTSMMQGLKEQKVTSCLKHFPGIGSSVKDTHDGMTISERSAEDFQTNEFEVFRAGIEAGADMIMVGHMAVPAFTGDNTPSSLSDKVVTDILRNQLGFKGVIISDALNMSAISEYHSSEDAAVLALKAGCDMLLMPENFEEAYEGVLKAVQDGVISEERINDSLRRIYRIKYADKMED